MSDECKHYWVFYCATSAQDEGDGALGDVSFRCKHCMMIADVTVYLKDTHTRSYNTLSGQPEVNQ